MYDELFVLLSLFTRAVYYKESLIEVLMDIVQKLEEIIEEHDEEEKAIMYSLSRFLEPYKAFMLEYLKVLYDGLSNDAQAAMQIYEVLYQATHFSGYKDKYEEIRANLEKAFEVKQKLERIFEGEHMDMSPMDLIKIFKDLTDITGIMIKQYEEAKAEAEKVKKLYEKLR